MLDVDLDGLAGDGKLSTAPRARSISLEGDPRDMVAPQDLMHDGDGHVDWWLAQQKRQIWTGPYWRTWRTWSTRACICGGVAKGCRRGPQRWALRPRPGFKHGFEFRWSHHAPQD